MLRTRLWKQSCLRNHQKRNKTFKNFNLYVILLIYRFSKFEQLLFKKVVEFSNIHLYVYLFFNVFHKVFGKNKCPNCPSYSNFAQWKYGTCYLTVTIYWFTDFPDGQFSIANELFHDIWTILFSIDYLQFMVIQCSALILQIWIVELQYFFKQIKTCFPYPRGGRGWGTCAQF